MKILEIFSKRQKKERGEVPDVYTYTDLPRPLRTQIVHIWFDILGSESDYFNENVKSAYKFIVEALCREYGIFRLPPSKDQGRRDYMEELVNFLIKEQDIEKVLDAVEVSFLVVDHFTRKSSYLNRNDSWKLADDAIAELNARFQEHGVGFQFSHSKIIRIDSEFLHAEVVRPAIRVLRGSGYEGAQEEFLKAHEHYRHGNSKEALNECLKAFESVMKAICEKRRWPHKNTATAKDLIGVCLDNGLIPAFWQNYYASLRSMLESGVPTGRNKLGGHGQGVVPTTVPSHLVSFLLHMTAASILFLVEGEEGLE